MSCGEYEVDANAVTAKVAFLVQTLAIAVHSPISLARFLADRVADYIFLNPVTDEELLNIVHSAKYKKSKCYDSIDMCLLQKPFRTS